MEYEVFASIYDEVMDEELYAQWLAFTKRHTPKQAKTPVKLLELACGTGRLACQLAKANYAVTGLDLSDEMLTIAYNRALEEAVDIQFLTGDMRDLDEIGTYDMITCYSDSLCYLADTMEVQACFDGVFKGLEESGIFIFDVHSLYQIDKAFPEYSYHYQTDDFAFLWESYSGEVPHSIEHLLTFFIKQNEEKELFQRFDELHNERTYPIDTYQYLLENAGFSSVKVYADFTDEKPTETSRRWFFVCQK